MQEEVILFVGSVFMAVAAWIGAKHLKEKIEFEFSRNPEILPPNGDAPMTLFRINLIGVTLFGDFRHCEINGEDTFVSYYCICFIIPLIPLKCYRVIQSGNSYSFIGSDRMKGIELFCILLNILKWGTSIFTIILLLILFF